jgi:hypothetical protein
MRCHELSEALRHWRSTEQERFAIIVDEGDVHFSKLENAILISASLALPTEDEALLQDALRLAHPSLARFPGALALSPEDGRLWLLAQLESTCHEDDLLSTLEPLINQRDSWQSMLSTERAGSRFTASRLPATPAFVEKGTRYA